MKKIVLSLVFVILASTVYSQSAKDTFCKTFTKNAQQGKGFTKSHFKYNNDVFIQVMDINEMANDKSIQYDLIVKEASNQDFRDMMAKKIIQRYSSLGLSEVFKSNGFSQFQIYLLKKDGSTMISKVWNL